ncbi:DUF7402 domain-containing protein [Tenggerimyces flavus]|uniref:F5/8 type C domain-containing protein n=1 Tax=Tenggerimyces flavus TaxID=1708749 RepID=A0ABV7YL99_9ACTN|nr:hypothetical protein [Tenggerimyces flavus]MBM7789835.1 hypothetical protein [Tenggerimyces flavus]
MRIGTFATVLTLLGALLWAASPPPIAQAAVTATADFSVDAGPGHAEVFGSGINVPRLTDTNKIETLHQTGTRFIRGDAYLDDILPKDTSIAGYLEAMPSGTGVADPTTWDWSKYAWVDEHHKRGAKIVLILAYNISWLSANGKQFGPPNGPDGYRVYGDVVGKIYRHFKDKVHLVEVWNEPDLDIFLDLPDGTTMAQRIEVYTKIYETAADAVQAADPHSDVPIGGPVMSHPNVGLQWIDKLLRDTRVKDDINFLSYHVYNHYDSFRDEQVTQWKQAARDLGKGEDFPVYVTEWNWDPVYGDVPMNGNHPHTISYAAWRLSTFLKQHTNGTNYFADNDEAEVPEFFGVHRNGMLPPKARVYRLMSVDLGLGAGASRLRPMTYPTSISSAGAAMNANGDRVAWLVNDGTAPLEVELNLTGLGSATSTTATVFEASPIQPTTAPKTSVPLQVTGGAARLDVAVPAKSLIGVRLGATPIADVENLARTATVTPSSVSAEAPQLAGPNVVDGVVGIHARGEWASHRELRPSITLSWPTPQTIGQVVLYDRANPTDRINAGRVVFSDGSVVDVPALVNDGVTGKAISFPARTATSVRLEVTNGAGSNVGLSELQVFAGDNVAREGTLTTSTQADLGPRGQLRATDGNSTSTGEWVSTETNPWVQVSWVNSHQIDRVVLHDRVSTASNVNGGTLTFSDGSSVAVSGVPANGAAKVVSFPPKSVTSVRFQAAGGTGSGNGLAELRILSAGNLASSAVATASSSAGDPGLGPSAAVDGVVNQWFAGEWASNGQLNPSFRLTWTTPQTLGQVVLYDRNNLVDHAPGGTLVFSDGSQEPVSGIDNTGVGKPVPFSPRTVTWLEFHPAVGRGLNVGLSEVEAFATRPS